MPTAAKWYEDKMEPSQRLWEYLKSKERFRQYPERDEYGVLHIGFGHKIQPRETFERLNTREAEMLMRRDVYPILNCINKNITAPLNQNQFDALVSLAYNIGITAFRNSRVRKFLSRGPWETMDERYLWAAEAMHKWNKVTINGVKRISNGLVRRRLEESEWFMEPIREETK